VTMGATLLWPAVAVLGFLLSSGVVVALGASSTARYEFERNGARAPQRSAAESQSAHPAGRRSPSTPAGASDAQAMAQSIGLAVRPAAVTATGAERGWWLVGESAQVLAGPFTDQIDADWAALANGLAAVAVFGSRRTDGGIAPRPTPEEQAWLGELGDQLDRLPEEWDVLESDTDPLTTLVVEVTAALLEAGLSLHDAPGGSSAGGVCLVPELGSRGVLVSWRAHDRLSLHHMRGTTPDAAVQQLMNTTVAGVLAQLGFVVEPYGTGGCSLVTAIR
jgi:hypothetical protein